MKSVAHQTHESDESRRPIASFPRVVFTFFLFLVVWIATAGVVGFFTVLIFPSPSGSLEFGIGLDWRNLPGAVLGFLAACRTWRAMIDR